MQITSFPNVNLISNLVGADKPVDATYRGAPSLIIAGYNHCMAMHPYNKHTS